MKRTTSYHLNVMPVIISLVRYENEKAHKAAGKTTQDYNIVHITKT